MNAQNRQIAPEISVLENSYKYFLEHVVIVKYPGHYRLLIIHQGSIIEDREYSSGKGARMAFVKRYDRQKWKESDNPEWSDFYDPGKSDRTHYPYSVDEYLKKRVKI